MSPLKHRLGSKKQILIALGLLGVSAAGIVGWRIHRAVRGALAMEDGRTATIRWTPLKTMVEVECWGGSSVEALAFIKGELYTGGGFGIASPSGLLKGLPTLSIATLQSWRGKLVAAPSKGGLFLRQDGAWQEALCAFGTLHVRALLEGPGGELYIGAQEGLFRTLWQSNRMERLDDFPVRSLTLLENGLVLAGGEKGLRLQEGQGPKSLPCPDPWVNWVGSHGKQILALTAKGLVGGHPDSPLKSLKQSLDIQSVIQIGAQLYFIESERLFKLDLQSLNAPRMGEIFPNAPAKKLFAHQGQLFLDTPDGLYLQQAGHMQRVRTRMSGLPGSAFVNALAPCPAFSGSAQDETGSLAIGLFDGGLLLAQPKDHSFEFQKPPSAPTWGINALQAQGRELLIASLRGAYRYDGREFKPLSEASGAAFCFCQGREGLFIGYGQGLWTAENRMISAFHGLPGNQTLALCATPDQPERMFVGSPSGLGLLENGRVIWRNLPGDGSLPHPWVTNVTLHQNTLFVGTYGGGLTRATLKPGGSLGRFEHLPESAGMKINPHCLLEAGKTLYLGTDNQGLYRLNPSQNRFEPVKVQLPSPRITALMQQGQWIYIGTDEGLARIKAM